MSSRAAYQQDVTDVYDAFYRGRGKDFAAEASAVAAVISGLRPGAASLLDMACGTGEHLGTFAACFPDVAGMDISAAMCTLSRRKHPGLQVHQADIREFSLGREFDSVCSMTSTLGYMADFEQLKRAVTCMARHLVRGGVLVIDPWWTPDQFLDGFIARDLIREDGRTIARLSRSARTGRSVTNEAHYIVADSQEITHFSHTQQFTLFTRTEYIAAIENAGCAARHIENEQFMPRGLLVGIRQ